MLKAIKTETKCTNNTRVQQLKSTRERIHWNAHIYQK